MRGIRTERYKYIRYFDKNGLFDVPADCQFGATYRALGPQMRTGYEALYDLAADPYERHNLATDPQHQDVRADLARRLHDELTRTGDPLLDGPVASPFYHASVAEFSLPTKRAVTVVGWYCETKVMM